MQHKQRVVSGLDKLLRLMENLRVQVRRPPSRPRTPPPPENTSLPVLAGRERRLAAGAREQAESNFAGYAEWDDAPGPALLAAAAREAGSDGGAGGGGGDDGPLGAEVLPHEQEEPEPEG